jgi:tetratricopeptide (TPR) repeat protein
MSDQGFPRKRPPAEDTDALARPQKSARHPASAGPRGRDGADARGEEDRADLGGLTAGASTNKLQVLEFARGLQQGVLEAIVSGLVQGLGLDSSHDPRDVTAELLRLDDGGTALIHEHCVPRVVERIAKGISGLQEDAAQTVEAANSRYADEPDVLIAMMGEIHHFEQGLDKYNGRPDGEDLEAQMRLEFSDSTPFCTLNYGGIETTLETEWEFVVNPQSVKVYPGEQGLQRADGSRWPGRNRNSVEELMTIPSSRDAHLTREEVIGLRLYTGPSYIALNGGLRQGGAAARKKGIQNFPATCAALNSAIKKLRLVTPLPRERKLYRGLKEVALSQQVLDEGGFVELGFTSATPHPELAKEYAGSHTASIFEIDVSKIDRGAFVGKYSQYEEEDEYVLPCLSYFEIIGRKREFNINIYMLRLNINMRSQTLEELRENRLTMVLEMASKLNIECQQMLGCDSAIVQQAVDQFTSVGPEWYNKALNYTDTVGKLEARFVEELEAAAQALWEEAGALPPERAPERVEKLRKRVRVLKRCCRDDAAGKKRLLLALEELGAAVLSLTPADLNSTDANDLVELAAQLETTASGYTRAMELLLRALHVKLSLVPAAPPAEVALIRHRQGRVLYAMGRYQEALAEYQKSIDIRVAVFGPDHTLVADSQFNMGEAYRKQGKYDEALHVYRKALQVFAAVKGKENEDAYQAYGSIGICYKKQGRFNEALEMYQQSLEMKIRVCGHEHPDVAKSYMNVASVYCCLGKYAEAVLQYQKSLDIKIKVLGNTHPTTAQTLMGMANVYHQQGDFDNALLRHQEALEVFEAVHGQTHPLVADSLNYIGNVYQAQSKYTEALDKYRKSLGIVIKVRGPHHPLVATAHNNMGVVHELMDDLEHALCEHQKALDIRTSVLHNEHPDVASSKENMGLVLQRMGKLDQARTLFTEAADVWRKVFGTDHRLTKRAERLASGGSRNSNCEN